MIEEFYYILIILLIYNFISKVNFINYNYDLNYNFKYDIYILTLDKNKDKHKFLINNIKDNFKFFYGLSINNIEDKSNNIFIDKYIKSNSINSIEICNFINHFNIWTLLKYKDTPTIILEDDIIISDSFYNYDLHDNIPKDFDIFYLGTNNNNYDDNICYNIYKTTNPNGLFGYLISNKGINKLLNHFENNKIDKSLDLYLINNLIINNILIAYTVFPNVIIKNNFVEMKNQNYNNHLLFHV